MFQLIFFLAVMSGEDRSCLIMKSMSTCLMKSTQCGPKQLCSLYKTLMLIMEKRHFAWEHKDKAPEQWMKVMWSKKRGQQSVAPIMPSAHCVSLWGCVGVWSRSVGHFRTSMAQRAPTESSSSRRAQSMKECRTLKSLWDVLQKTVCSSPTFPSSIQDLWVDPAALHELINMMLWWFNGIIKAKGDPTNFTEKTFEISTVLLNWL